MTTADVTALDQSDYQDRKVAILAAVKTCNWPQYQAILANCRDLTWFDDMASDLLDMLVSLRCDQPNQSDDCGQSHYCEVPVQLHKIAHSKIIKSLIAVKGFLETSLSEASFEHACLRGSLESVKILLAAGCETTLTLLMRLLKHLYDSCSDPDTYETMTDANYDEYVSKFNLLVDYCQLDLGWIFLTSEYLIEYDHRCSSTTSGNSFRYSFSTIPP